MTISHGDLDVLDLDRIDEVGPVGMQGFFLVLVHFDHALADHLPVEIPGWHGWVHDVWQDILCDEIPLELYRLHSHHNTYFDEVWRQIPCAFDRHG